MKLVTQTNHCFLDEAGDTTFYGKGKVNIIGTNGVSSCFILGMLKLREPLAEVRSRIQVLRTEVIVDPYYADVPSIRKKVADQGYYFHATDDPAEIRKTFFDFVRTLDCSFEAVVARKIPSLYETKHNGKESEFYADLLSHLLKNKVHQPAEKLVLNIAQRGKTTRNAVLDLALEKAKIRAANQQTIRNQRRAKIVETGTLLPGEIKPNIVFNIQNHNTEPLLNVVDYFCWAIQRVFERGEVRYYNFLKDRVSLVVDLYDSSRYENSGNYYGPRRPLTTENKISPPLH